MIMSGEDWETVDRKERTIRGTRLNGIKGEKKIKDIQRANGNGQEEENTISTRPGSAPRRTSIVIGIHSSQLLRCPAAS